MSTGKGWKGWFGFDFDGTLAKTAEDWNGGETLGEPVMPMVEQVKALLARGEEVRIVTARVGGSGATNEEGQRDDAKFCARQRELVEAWCVEHIGQKLPVTASKDFRMLYLFDDRAIQVIKDTGVPVVEDAMQSLQAAEILYSHLAGCTLTPAALEAAKQLHVALGLPETVKLENVEEKRIIEAPAPRPFQNRHRR